MQSKLFQIEKEGISMVDLMAKDIHPACDWFRVSKTVEDDLASLERCLPKGCFQLEGRNLTLLKKPSDYLMEFLEEVKLSFNLLTPKDLGTVSYLKALRKARTNNITYRVYSEYFGVSVPFIEWLTGEVMTSSIGQVFIIGSVINYYI